MRGFGVTLDAVVALSFLLFAMLVISSQWYNPRAPGGIYLKQLTLDAVSVLEKTGRIDRAIEGDGGAMPEILEATPELACIGVYVIDSSGTVAASAVKDGCGDNYGLDVQVSASPARHRGANYVIRTESWFRREQ
ncbi:MAG: hypothetical protein AB1324_06855 [Candidatus Micrarchaeota archaeon]